MILELSLICLFLILVKLFPFKKKAISNHSKLPPGPWGIPILGHLHLLGSSPHRKLLQWKKIYGPIYFIRFGCFPTVVLSDAKLIKEAFSLPSFAGRGQLRPMVEGSNGKGLGMSEGKDNAEQRAFVMRNLRDLGYGRRTMEEKIQTEVEELLTVLEVRRGQAINVRTLFHTSIINSLWSIMMNERFDLDDPAIARLVYLLSERLVHSDTLLGRLSLFLPAIGTFMPEFSGFNDKVAAFREIDDYMRTRIEEKKATWVKGQPRDLVDAYLDKVDDTTDVNSSFHASKDFHATTTGDMFNGALETTSTTLEWLMNYLATSPSVQDKIRLEIEREVGWTRTPTLIDRPRLPYSVAVVEELLRIRPALAMGVFHRTLEDVDFHSFKIPKDTMVISNLWGVQHDEDTWANPEEFLPERFLGPDGKLIKNENVLAFSAGRRVCPGEGLARDQLFLYTTSLCQKFHICFPTGQPPVKEIFGFSLQPEPFQVRFIEIEQDQ